MRSEYPLQKVSLSAKIAEDLVRNGRDELQPRASPALGLFRLPMPIRLRTDNKSQPGIEFPALIA